MALDGSTLKGLVSSDLTASGFVLEADSYMDAFLEAICNGVVTHIQTSSTLIPLTTDPDGGMITGTVG